MFDRTIPRRLATPQPARLAPPWSEEASGAAELEEIVTDQLILRHPRYLLLLSCVELSVGVQISVFGLICRVYDGCPLATAIWCGCVLSATGLLGILFVKIWSRRAVLLCLIVASGVSLALSVGLFTLTALALKAEESRLKGRWDYIQQTYVGLNRIVQDTKMAMWTLELVLAPVEVVCLVASLTLQLINLRLAIVGSPGRRAYYVAPSHLGHQMLLVPVSVKTRIRPTSDQEESDDDYYDPHLVPKIDAVDSVPDDVAIMMQPETFSIIQLFYQKGKNRVEGVVQLCSCAVQSVCSSCVCGVEMPLKIDDFHIEFHQRWGVYHPGEPVTGDVFLALGADFHCDRLEANFFGSARVFWCAREMRDGQFHNVPFTNENVYFNKKSSLWASEGRNPQQPEWTVGGVGKKTDSDRSTLEMGRHQYPLCFQLPDDIPTSFDARDSPGYIRYWVKVSLLQLGVTKASRKAFFSVVRPRDLNLIPGAGLPVYRQSLMDSVDPKCCGSATTSAMSMLVQLDKKGFVAGESLQANVSLSGADNHNPKSVRIALLQKIFCFAKSPEPRVTESLNELTATLQPFRKQTELSRQVEVQLTLFLPAIVPSFAEPQLIECEYFVQVEAHFKGGKHLKLQLPIEVGSIPLVIPTAGTPESYMAYGPPPTYEESVLGASPLGGDDGYLPRYASYDFQRRPPPSSMAQ